MFISVHVYLPRSTAKRDTIEERGTHGMRHRASVVLRSYRVLHKYQTSYLHALPVTPDLMQIGSHGEGMKVGRPEVMVLDPVGIEPESHNLGSEIIST